MNCSFCHRPEEELDVLIPGPSSSEAICDSCVKVIATGLSSRNSRSSSAYSKHNAFSCSFCGSENSGDYGIAIGGNSKICKNCISMCVDILSKQPKTIMWSHIGEQDNSMTNAPLGI